MEIKKLDFSETFKDAIAIGVKNAPSVLAAVALWLVTIWIPYINIGTTIAMQLLPTELAKGNVINPLSIFDAKYRRHMGDFLIMTGLAVLAIYGAMIFMFFPAIVLALSWSLSFYYMLEKGKGVLESFKASNEATYGSKWTMFFVQLVFGVVVGILGMIISVVCGLIGSGFITFIFMLVFIVCAASIAMAISASYWKQLKDNVA